MNEWYFDKYEWVVKFTEDFMSEITINSPEYEKKYICSISDQIMEQIIESNPDAWIKKTDYKRLSKRPTSTWMSFDKLLTIQADAKVSDIHVGRWDFPIFKMGNDQLRVWFEYEWAEVFTWPFWKTVLSFDDSRILFFDWLDPNQKTQLLTEWSVNREYKLLRTDEEWKEFIQKFRLNIHLEKGWFAISCRYINAAIPRLEDMKGIPNDFKKFANYPSGLVVVSAPTNNGKSFTLNAMIDYINRNFEKHIITIEDPIEAMFEPKKSKFTQRQVGSDTLSTMKASKDVLRQDGNVALVWEVRTAEELEAAINLAINGLLVFVTSHAASSQMLFEYVNSISPSDRRSQIIADFSSVLVWILCQRLNRKQVVDQDTWEEKTLYLTSYELLVNNNKLKSALRPNEQWRIDFKAVWNNVLSEWKMYWNIHVNHYLMEKLKDPDSWFDIHDCFKMTYDVEWLKKILIENWFSIPPEITAKYI